MTQTEILQVLATLLATFLGPWFAFRLAKRHQDLRDAREKDSARSRLTLEVLREYEDPEFSNRRITLAEFQRDWATRREQILDIVYPSHGQTVASFFQDDPQAPVYLAQHQNVNRFLAYLFMLEAYAERGLIDPALLKIFAPRYNAYRHLMHDLRLAVLERARSEGTSEPVWCDAIPRLERILGLPPLAA